MEDIMFTYLLNEINFYTSYISRDPRMQGYLPTFDGIVTVYAYYTCTDVERARISISGVFRIS